MLCCTFRFYSGIERCGLTCVLICDGSCSPGHEAKYVAQRRLEADAWIKQPPTSGMALQQAYADLGLHVETSVLCADKLLLAWYRKHSASIYAVGREGWREEG